MNNSVLHSHNTPTYSSSSSSRNRSQRDVHYSCGSCGYDLNLSSSNRNTSSIDSKYGKSIKRGMISFFNIDDTRFTQADEVQCAPHFSKNLLWGLFRRRTKLRCRKCCNHIGYASQSSSSPSFILVSSNGTEPSPSTETPSQVKYEIRIRALQPSSSLDYGNGISVLA
ncbi:uncharacterized protein At4g08330, chloroplastic [Lathyrus oleraceus]|uniref:Uncharacterized protein n=1 Tax=Pisum sativum TaxID=3888 RepID=A0A9D4WP89_PEA|nr:uncharacterized protein At4g08330, chloroplastic-like [Pisum sativum]KAI5405956.1 hypothetical protein KIW84_052637 [Pisum sativum]